MHYEDLPEEMRRVTVIVDHEDLPKELQWQYPPRIFNGAEMSATGVISISYNHESCIDLWLHEGGKKWVLKSRLPDESERLNETALDGILKVLRDNLDDRTIHVILMDLAKVRQPLSFQSTTKALLAQYDETHNLGDIKDECPCCKKIYEYKNDYYDGGTEEVIEDTEDRTVTLSLCDCGGIIAATITDQKFGSQVYVPSKQPV